MLRSAISFYVRATPFSPRKKKVLSTILRLLPSMPVKSRYDVLLYSNGSDNTNMFSLLGEYDDVFAVVSTIRPGMAFLDLGANAGVFSMVAAKHTGVDGITVAFEPNPTVFSKLIANASVNALTNFFPFMAAIGLSTGVERFAADDNHTGMGHLDTAGDMRVVQLGGSTLCALLKKLIDGRKTMVKVDVEGAELIVLKAIGALLESQLIETAIVEIDANQQSRFDSCPNEIYDFMRSKGYEPHFGAEYATHFNEIFSLKQPVAQTSPLRTPGLRSLVTPDSPSGVPLPPGAI